MTKLAWIGQLTLNDPYSAYPDPYQSTGRLRKNWVCSCYRDWNLQNSNDSRHVNYLLHRRLYDIGEFEVVRSAVYIVSNIDSLLNYVSGGLLLLVLEIWRPPGHMSKTCFWKLKTLFNDQGLVAKYLKKISTHLTRLFPEARVIGQYT